MRLISFAEGMEQGITRKQGRASRALMSIPAKDESRLAWWI
jgi:hypothetical protein